MPQVFEQIRDELPLCLILAIRGFVDVSSRRLVADDETLLGHDLQQLEERGVAALASHHLRDLADGAGPPRPQHAQDGELGVGRLAARGFHAPDYVRHPS